ncbi:gamma-glutamyl-gamma-aminobutyrate hydrolase family protein [Alkalicaulis satelles]|uniref:Gamma-glutamyl-gamma-aminobutyrate hydrolase family protein n=1 Tax=Alkalicaulis satelles TaxID=2609175 RepID=A0A5M6ZGM9_9PROT|nr:gamma-glutamyl-gamma-aminobutyrate hydrolase family protein [Alkalicaulis satelles]KAA5803923.1 gamma-glutamyl-gamma-aminobutyrate hydrolase family protein [Alkalicaulis satelles]
MSEPSCAARRPVIAVTSSAGTDYGVFALIWAGVRLAGGRAVRVTSRTRDVQPDAFDGLILAGGLNIHPDNYGRAVNPAARYDRGRDGLELEWAQAFWALKRPVLAICRGMQLLNVARGGAVNDILDEDLLRTLPSTPLGYMLYRKSVDIAPGTRLSELWGRTRARVNSLHRQAVAELGEGLRVSARGEHGEAQALEGPPGVLRMAVQFHPELMLHRRDMRVLFRALVDAARRCDGESPANASQTGL